MKMKRLGIPSRGGWQNFSGMQWRQKLGTRWTIGSSPSAKKHQVVVVTFIQVSTLLQMWQDDKAKCWWWPSCRFGNWTKWVCWWLFSMDNVTSKVLYIKLLPEDSVAVISWSAQMPCLTNTCCNIASFQGYCFLSIVVYATQCYFFEHVMLIHWC